MRKVLLVLMAIWGALMLSCSPEKMPEGNTVAPGPVVVTPSITVDKTSLSFNNTSSTETLMITANVEWEAECSDTWVTVAKSSSTQLNVSVTANQGEARTSTITLKQQGKTTAMATITVSQVAADVEISVSPSSLSFESEVSSKTVTVTSNVEWEAECVDTWVTVSKSSPTQLSVSVTANQGEARTSTITLKQQGKSTAIATITVSQAAIVAAITVSPSTLSFESDATSKTVTVTSNVEWEAECSDTWVTLKKDSPSQLSVSVTANQGDARTSTIALKQKDKSTAIATIIVSQKEVVPEITVSPSSLSFGYDSSSKTVTVTSNVEWSYDYSDSWTTVTKDGPSKLTVSVTTNTSSARSSKIYLREQGKFTTLATINISQEAISSVSGNTYTVKGVSFKMIPVEGGTFTMGATTEQGSDAQPLEKPAHSVTLSSYSIGETEVTQELWEAVMGSNPSYYENKKNPVNYVSWDDCQEFIRKLNSLTGKKFRLPTEAEWEYAARGGKKSRGYKYAGSNVIGNVAWYDVNANNSGSSTVFGPQSVGGMAPNELGLYDMSGNVWEWSSDGFSAYTSKAQTNPTVPSSDSIRMFRGGSWASAAKYCRVSYRNASSPSYRDRNLGLRLAL